MRVLTLCGLAALCVALTACESEKQIVELTLTPATLTADATGYYCHMGLTEHSGPQAQMYVQGSDEPIWFSQVRDAVVYLRSPEELRSARAVFVNDMAVAPGWDEPGVDNWISIHNAALVIESSRTGGMGAPEVIPFGSRSAALEFIEQHGGRIVSLDEIPDNYVLSPMAM